jgi:K+-transporting ATPase KdpF subunit
METQYVMALCVAIVLWGYLTAALLWPERFE